jgi:hypothetical protein
MSTPVATSFVRWISLQDLLRRQSQALEKIKSRMHLAGLALALIMPLSSLLAAAFLRYGSPDMSHVFVAVLGIAGLGLEFVGQLLKTRMTKLNVISRRALAIIMPQDALGVEPRDESWRRILDQSGIKEVEVDTWSKTPKNQKRFASWWATARPRDDGGRLQAVLLDNVIWTQAILKAMSAKRTHLRLWSGVVLVAILLLVASIRPVGLTELVEFVLIPVILFSLAFNGIGTTDYEIWDDAADEIDAIYDQLRGIDDRNDSHSLCISLYCRYFALTSSLPPVCTKLYEDENTQKSLHERTKSDSLDEYLNVQ